MKSVKGNNITNKVLSEDSYRFSDSTPDETIYNKIGRNVGVFYCYWCDTCSWDKGYMSIYTDNFNYAKAHAHHIFQVNGISECFLDYTKMKCITFEELFDKTHIKDVISRETNEGFHNGVEPVFDGNYEKYLKEITPEIHIITNFGASTDFNCITFSPEEGVTCYYVVEPPSGPKEGHPLVGMRKFMKADRFNDDIDIYINSGYINIYRKAKNGEYNILAEARIQTINCNEDLKEYFNLYTEKKSIYHDKFLQREIYASIDKNAPVALLTRFTTHSAYVPGMGVFKKFLEKIIEEYVGYNIIIPDDFLYELNKAKTRTRITVSNMGYQDIVDAERDDRVLSRYGFNEMSCGYVWLKKPEGNSLDESVAFFASSVPDEEVYKDISRNVGTLYFYWYDQTERGTDVELLVDSFKYAKNNCNMNHVQECFLDYVNIPCVSLEDLYKEGLSRYLENLASQEIINEVPKVIDGKYEKFFFEAYVYIKTFCKNKFGNQCKCVTYNPFPGITGYCLLGRSGDLLSGIRKRYKVHDKINLDIKKIINGVNHDYLVLQAFTSTWGGNRTFVGQFDFRIARDFEELKNEFKDSYRMGVQIYNSPFVKKEILKSVDKKASTITFYSYHITPNYPQNNGIFGRIVDYLINEYGSECNFIFNDDFLYKNYKNNMRMSQMKERDIDDMFFEKRGFKPLSFDYVWIRKPSANSVNEVIGIGLDDIKQMVKESVGQIMNEAFSNGSLFVKYKEGYDLWYAYYLPNLKDAPNPAIYASQSYDYARKKSKEYSQSIYQLVIRRDTLNCIDFDAMNRIYCNGKMKVNEVPEHGTLQAMRDKFNAAVFTDEGVTNIFLFNAEHVIYDIDLLKSPVSRDIDVWSERLTSDNILITAVENHKGQWHSLLGTMHLYDANIRFDDLTLHHNVFFKKEMSRYLDSSKRTLMIDDVNIRVIGCGTLTEMMKYIIKNYSVCSLLVRIPDDIKDASTLISMRVTTMTPEQLRKFFEKYGFEEIISHNGATWMIRRG